jgi:hypothetical protein
MKNLVVQRALAVTCSVGSTGTTEVAMTTQTGCTYCMTVKTYAANALTLTAKTCATTCTALDARVLGTGLVTTCCQTDNCSSAAFKQLFSSGLLFLAFLMKYFY